VAAFDFGEVGMSRRQFVRRLYEFPRRVESRCRGLCKTFGPFINRQLGVKTALLGMVVINVSVDSSELSPDQPSRAHRL
jgi:hypothetical protein